MIHSIMSTKIQKRRVIYCDDSLWEFVQRKAKEDNKSTSSSLRYFLESYLKWRYEHG